MEAFGGNSLGSCCSEEIYSLTISPATAKAQSFEIPVSSCLTVDDLKRCVGKRLRLAKEKISLLYKERLLKEGTLRENGLCSGCTLTLLPNIESGLMSSKPETNILQALENLSESQVNNFLSGKSPLMLCMRLGDHMMFVQLHLSTSSQRKSSASIQSPSVATMTPSLPSTSSSSRPCRVLLPAAAKTSEKLCTPPPMTSTASVKEFERSSHSIDIMENPCLSRDVTSGSSLPATSSSASCSSAAAVSGADAAQFPALVKALHGGGHEVSDRKRKCTDDHSDSHGTTSTSSSSSKRQRKSDRKWDESLEDLEEASRTLSKRLKQLTRVARTGVVALNRSGAIIESMHHHGQGVYSGTFSGTLNPALQDRDGRPKRDISTIIHILNDLLGALPQYHVSGHSAPNSDGRLVGSSPPRACNLNAECNSAENVTTRGKMEQLQQMLEQRRRRRLAERLAKQMREQPSMDMSNENLPKSSMASDAPQSAAMFSMGIYHQSNSSQPVSSDDKKDDSSSSSSSSSSSDLDSEVLLNTSEQLKSADEPDNVDLEIQEQTVVA